MRFRNELGWIVNGQVVSLFSHLSYSLSLSSFLGFKSGGVTGNGNGNGKGNGRLTARNTGNLPISNVTGAARVRTLSLALYVYIALTFISFIYIE